MGKRNNVPTALHSELTEYSALLRALRANDTLDLVTQLTRSHPVSSRASVDVEDPLSDDEGESERPLSSLPTEGAESRAGEAPKRKRKRKEGASASAPPRRERDLWTRWPLLEGDVHVPEWSFEDEVRHLAVRHLRASRSASASQSGTSQPQPGVDPAPAAGQPSEQTDDDDDEDELLPPVVTRNLVTASATHTSQMLAALAAHVPYAERDMQNRVKPINWETVLNVVGASGLADAKVLDDVRRRLEGIYGLGSSRAVQRTRTATAIGTKLNEICAPHELSFLAIPGYDTKTLLPKRKRGSYKKRKGSQKGGTQT